jgi:hypothetical protein
MYIRVKRRKKNDLSADFSHEYLITKPLNMKNTITASEPKRNRNPTLMPKTIIFEAASEKHYIECAKPRIASSLSISLFSFV